MLNKACQPMISIYMNTPFKFMNVPFLHLRKQQNGWKIEFLRNKTGGKQLFIGSLNENYSYVSNASCKCISEMLEKGQTPMSTSTLPKKEIHIDSSLSISPQ